LAVPSFSFFKGSRSSNCPGSTFRAILTFAGRDTEGQLVEAAADPWFAIIRMIQRDPGSIYRIDWRDWEEIVVTSTTIITNATNTAPFFQEKKQSPGRTPSGYPRNDVHLEPYTVYDHLAMRLGLTYSLTSIDNGCRIEVSHRTTSKHFWRSQDEGTRGCREEP
jgi:hypothetical protein